MAIKKDEFSVPTAKDQEKSLAVVKGKTENAVKEVSSMVVKSDEDLERATLVLTNVKKLQKFVTQEKEKIIKPLREATSAARGLFAPIEEQLDEAETKLKRAMITYQDKKQKEVDAKQASIVARAQKEGPGSLKPETAIKKMEEVGEVKTNVQTTNGSANFKKVKKVRVTDPAKVPDFYWVIDLVKVRGFALALSNDLGKIGELIPGVEVYEETNVAASA